MTTLVIVESPGKLKKLRGILGPDYRVEASRGHVRDLPPKEMGVAAPDFQPHYDPTDRGKATLKQLRAAVKETDSVLLATDPDREGEAIAWHLADALRLQHPTRITFQSIEPKAVKAAIAAPRPLDMELVHAQEARRVLDRIVGYRVSPALSDSAGQKLTAGRVQSPAVRLVVEREREIERFQSTTHFGVTLSFDGEWSAKWDVAPYLAEGERYFLDEDYARQVAEVRDVKVTAFADTTANRAPPAPFTTSTLQQAAQKQLKMRPKATMDTAQKLYEQGVITYHRTDTPNVSEEGFAALRAFGSAAGLFIIGEPRTWKSKAGAQEAHEAIRPTHFEERAAGETEAEKALYRLIWMRAVASQMQDAEYAVRTATLEATTAVGQKTPTFVAKGRTLIHPGWLELAGGDDDDKETEASNPVPELAEGDSVTAQDGRLDTKKTKPPKRYTQAALVKELERREIGRPSTYAAILDNITHRSYVTEDKKGYLLPLDAGNTVVDALVGPFHFIELDYTKTLENELDDVAAGKAQYRDVVSRTWAQLDADLGHLKPPADRPVYPCPECGEPMRQRTGKKGVFWGCSGYPDCVCTLPDDDGKPGMRKPKAAPSTEYQCGECNKPLVHRTGKGKKGKYDFWGCSGFPKCKKTYESDKDGKPILDA